MFRRTGCVRTSACWKTLNRPGMPLGCRKRTPGSALLSMQRADEQAVGVSIDREGHIYISHLSESRIEVYDQQGKLVGGFGEAGFRMGEFNGPQGLWIDKTDQIHVVDSHNARIEVFRLTPNPAVAASDKVAGSAEGN